MDDLTAPALQTLQGQGPIWDYLMERLKNRFPLPSQLPNPMTGMDGGPQLLAPMQAATPWALKVGGNSAVLSLPANKGANFEGYLNYNFNPFSPQDFRVNGGGLRYRYPF